MWIKSSTPDSVLSPNACFVGNTQTTSPSTGATTKLLSAIIPTPLPSAPLENALSLISDNLTNFPVAHPLTTTLFIIESSLLEDTAFSSEVSAFSLSLGIPKKYAATAAATKPIITAIIIE